MSTDISLVANYKTKLLYSFSKIFFLIFINSITEADINIDSTTNTAMSSINVNPFLFTLSPIIIIK